METPIRVLVVDDSALMRKLIPQILERDSSIQVVGTAMDGNFALHKIEEFKPHVVTLDLEMPGLNGLDTLKQIANNHRTRVIVVSAHSTEGAAITLKALAFGAFDFVAKPHDVFAHMPEIAEELIAKIKAAAESKGGASPYPLPRTREAPKKVAPSRVASSVIAIGISTGGPNALQYTLSQLPADFPAAVVIVQHMPEGFTEMFARRLDEVCALPVKEAQSGDQLLAGRILICPGNRHVRVKRLSLGDVTVLSDDPPVNGHRPSVDVLFESLAAEFGPHGIAVLMTGMGDDGSAGMGSVKAAGGITLAQSEESCVVYGMPRVAVERGFVQRVVGLDNLATTLQALCTKEPETSRAAAAAAFRRPQTGGR